MEEKRGQTSTEYLIFISVIFVLILIAVVPLVDFGSIGFGQQSKSYERYWVSAPIGVLSHAYNATHLVLNMQNNFKHNVRIDAILVDDALVYNGSFNMTPAQSVTYGFLYELDSYSIGEQYKFDLEINYTPFGFTGELDPYSAYYVFYGQAPILGTVGSISGITVLT